MEDGNTSLSIIEKLSGAIKIPTVSYLERDKIDYKRFLEFITFLKDSFPELHSKLKLDITLLLLILL